MNTAAPRVLRGIAIAIAVAAFIDPAVTVQRRTDATVAVVAVDSGDVALARRAAAELERTFTVVRAPFPGASATVLVGARLPPDAAHLAAPVFAVLPAPERPAVAVARIDAPARAPLDARVRVDAVLHLRGAAGRALDVTLRDGDVVLDRVTRGSEPDAMADTAATHVRVPLAFVPARTGAVLLRVHATLAGAAQTADADVVIDVHARRWHVLFFEPRPSWMATFVRRALEQDGRFIVTSRTVTSRGISTDFGRPPPRLDADALAAYDAVVVGAPEALTDADVAGLERFMRRHGGAVLLLPDRYAPGPHERLADAGRWSARADGAFQIATADAPDAILRAAHIAWPASLPAGARTIAATTDGTPVIWAMSVGAGRLVVSGALDAWRFRDAGASAFDAFFRTLIADAAAAAPPAVDVRLSHGVVAPGAAVAVDVTLRDVGLAPFPADGTLRAAASASIAAGFADGTPVRLWPAAAPGVLRGSIRAPDEPGTYRITVTNDDDNDATVPLVVRERPAAPRDDRSSLVMAWAGARGGAALPAHHLRELPATIEAALRTERRRQPWHPMRSAWWIVPFALALGGEWWLRRRRGLP